ncbi:MAG: hypothetical protein GQ578_02230 [Desulfuromonadaceae bacterium]|nr:hypothetical protein [Desulfuromonadaceae bacterium]
MGCFKSEGHRLVFWYDPEQEFNSTLATLGLEEVRILRLDETGSFALKVKLELEDSSGQYLIYAPFAEPDRTRIRDTDTGRTKTTP